MSNIVVKFGGSNLRNQDDLNKVISIIRSYKRNTTIVLSAFYGITDLLEKTCKEAQLDANSIESNISELKTFHSNIIISSIDQEDYYLQVFKELHQLTDELISKLKGINFLKQIPLSIYDQILSTGEKFSAMILHYALLNKGVENQLYLPEDIGVITNGIFRQADINLDKTREQILRHIPKDQISIIPGFYGISEKGEITLLGRGGTDYTAAALAWCLDSVRLDLWKDTDGFCSADPRFVTNTVNVKNLNFDEAAELSYFGAGIIHPACIEPAKDKDIPIHIYDIRSAENLKPKSVINGNSEFDNQAVKSVTYSDQFSIIRLKGSEVGSKPGILSAVTGNLNEQSINISSVITSQIAINILIKKHQSELAISSIRNLHLTSLSSIELIDNICLIAVVGSGITEKVGIAGKVFKATTNSEINVKLCTLGASTKSMYLIIDKSDTLKTLNAVHNELFNTKLNNHFSTLLN